VNFVFSVHCNRELHQISFKAYLMEFILTHG
jgi:hypothetical protein